MNRTRRLAAAATCGLLLAVHTTVGAAAAGAAGPGDGLVVHTEHGDVGGFDSGRDLQWLGIPYAAPPIGDLRWRPPATAPAWDGVRPALDPAPPCPQPIPDVAWSEDCLYLNVFAPHGATAGDELPVLVHLHPGSNSLGRAYDDAHAFTERGAVVVTVGYRLGVLGFAGHPLLTEEDGVASGEYGILDQLAALEWVQRNIAGFGGDADRVTLFGMSAGSFDTAAIMASPLGEGLLDGAAVQGESSWGLTGRESTIREAEAFGADVSTAVGCAAEDDELACLRGLPAEDLVRAAGFGDFAPWTGGRVLPRPVIDLVQERDTVPLLIGHDREEDAFDVFDFERWSFPDPYGSGLWVRDANTLLGPRVGARAREVYPADEYAGSLLWSYVTMQTDAVRGCPTRRLAGAVDGPVWRYLYTNVYESDPEERELRAMHTFEEPLLWDLDWGIDTTAAERELGAAMADYWVAFARTGDPNVAGRPMWPGYDDQREAVLVLDDRITTVEAFHRRQCDVVDTAPLVFPTRGAAGGGGGRGGT